MSEARINRISNELGTGGPIVSGITTFSNVNYFVPPRGTTAERPSNCPPGSIRFNTDSAHLEYFDGLQWLEFEATNNELGVSGALGNRGLFAGGTISPGVNTNTIEYITISTLGNAIDFGDLTEEKRNVPASFASSTRGMLTGGYVGPAASNVINFVTISSTGNATDSGDLTVARGGMGGLSSSTRGLTCGSADPATNIIDYVTIASTGNAVDFGDLNNNARYNQTCASSTRGIIAGGRTPATLNVIDYVTIATTGNASDFGDLQTASDLNSGCSNSTRGLLVTNANSNKQIDFITIATLGNSQTFGDRTVGLDYNSACASSTRGIFGGGYGPITNVIDYVTILTTGNAQDFGDLTTAKGVGAACSNGHGGL